MSWGAVQTSSEACGIHPAADWSWWIAQGKAPEAGSGISFELRRDEDLEQLAGLGCKELAVTLEWAALCPRPGQYDLDALQKHRETLAAVQDAGMDAWACLVDGSLPGWFSVDSDGFRDEESRNLVWPRHVEWVGEQMGDLVDGWIPQREPLHWALKSQFLGLAPPGTRDSVKTEAEVAGRLKADATALRVLQDSAPVAAFHTARVVAPRRNQHNDEEDLAARSEASWIEQLLWSFADALNEETVMVDRVFVQLRPAVEVDGEGAWTPSQRLNLLQGVELAAERVRDNLDARRLTVVTDLAPVSGDGAALSDHVDAVRGIAEGIGADWWASSPISGWNWENGFQVSPGLIALDRTVRVHP